MKPLQCGLLSYKMEFPSFSMVTGVVAAPAHIGPSPDLIIKHHRITKSFQATKICWLGFFGGVVFLPQLFAHFQALAPRTSTLVIFLHLLVYNKRCHNHVSCENESNQNAL